MKVIYTDGSCIRPNDAGGWAWVETTERDEWVRARLGYAYSTTNQRMELMAVVAAMTVPGDLLVVSDSAYVVNCFNDGWWVRWRDNGWRNAKKKPVANRDLWEVAVNAYLLRTTELDEATVFEHVRGHQGDYGNEMADQLAGMARIFRWGGGLDQVDLQAIAAQPGWVPPQVR